MSLFEDFDTFLVAQALATADWPVSYGVMPPEPDQVIALFPSGGDPMPTKRLGIDAPALQVRVRGAARGGYAAAYAKAEAIATALHEAHGLIGATVYPWVLANHPPLAIGYDENNRPEFVVNFRIAREAA